MNEVKVLDKTDKYSLTLEFMGKAHGGWWLELINRATGNVKILMSQNKSVFEGTDIAAATRGLANEEWKPMYKAGVC